MRRSRFWNFFSKSCAEFSIDDERSIRASRRRNVLRSLQTQCIESLEDRRLLAANLVKDIGTAPLVVSFSPNQFRQAGANVFFVATAEGFGRELWKSDGTTVGTQMVKDIFVGSNNSGINDLTEVNGTLFFTANDGANGIELWKSDGTAAGTTMVKDIANGAGASSPGSLLNANGILYFRATDGTSGGELWKSDGTSAGTVQVKDIFPGVGVSNPSNLFLVNTTVFFTANDGTTGIELWRSDGTSTGTVQVKDVRTGASSSLPTLFANISGTLFFAANDGSTGTELWKSDGTAAGTVLVKDMITGVSSSSPQDLTNVGGTLYFKATDSVNGTELWKSNGTAGGTVVVKDIVPGINSSSPTNFINFNGVLVFIANDTTNGLELWKSDGTAVGTVLVKDIAPGTASTYPGRAAIFNGQLYFSASDTNGAELWKSDGTNAGTVLVKDINPGTASSNPNYLTNASGRLWFGANAALWNSDGTTVGTVLVKDNPISNASGNSAFDNYTFPVNLNGKLIFRATNALWGSDSTAGGTIMLGSTADFPFYMTNIAGTVFYRGGNNLWKTDGTVAGTTLIKNVGLQANLVNVNGALYAAGSDGTNSGLWSSDGTAAGTIFLKSLGIGFAGLTNVDGTLYFPGSLSASGSELWKSDGTPEGTVLVKDILTGTSSSTPKYITEVNGTAYFSANDGANGIELWRSDGSTNGTTMVRDIVVGTSSSSSNPKFITNVNGVLYFQANDGVNGVELWRSDGTFAGTSMVKNIATGSASSGPQNLININGTLYFRANDGTNGFELWKSDGTAAGTVMVKDIWMGVGQSRLQTITLPMNQIVNVNGWAVFGANDGINGEEVWISDGTSQGTHMLADVFPGSAGSLAIQFTQAGSQLMFYATGPGVGTELWSIPLPPYSLDHGVLTIDLANSVANRNLTIKVDAGNLSIFDSVTNSDILSASAEFPISASAVQRIRILGSSAFSENILIDHSFGGVINLPQGIEFDGGAGGNDTVTVVGTTGVDATISQSATDVSVSSVNSSANIPLKFRNAESLNISAMRRISVSSSWDVNIPISVTHQAPLDLGGVTALVGGSITSNNAVALGSGEMVTGAGTISGRFAGEAGSSIVASGTMTLGNATSSAGFLTRGEFDSGTSTVTLLDANQAVLGSLTSLGNATTTGTVVAANGALIDFGNNLVGYGTLSTVNSAALPTIINGSVDGTSLAKPITLSGYVKGVGSLNNVSITGTYSPGFSPAVVNVGSIAYAPSSVTTIELGGTVPGTHYDQINHAGQALLGGTLNVQLINGYQPAIGDSFTILTATGGVTGSFSSIALPSLPVTRGWQVITSNNQVVLNVVVVNVAPSDIALSSSSSRENIGTGTAIGSLNSTDANVGDTFTYSLVSGQGDANNPSFTIDGTGTLRNSSAFNFETQASYSIRVRSTDQGGLFTEKSFTISVIDLPELASAPVFGDGTAQRSLVNQISLTFDGAITIGSNAFSLVKRGAQGGTVTTTTTTSINGLGQTVVQLAFSGALTRGAGSLVDGYYELTINGASLTRGTESLDINQDGIGGDSSVLGANEADNFFALFGDTNGDGLVGIAEFGQFRSAFGKLSSQVGYNVLFDFDGDGSVGISDFGQFRSKFGKPKMPF